jgi:SagB-type dehydrogenase family enzyme
LYALELYVSMAKGFYWYIPDSHQLECKSTADLRRALYLASEQEAVLGGGAVFVITVIYGRLAEKYDEERSVRYAHLEAGHAAQNLLLQATALGLAAVPIGAFPDEEIQAL